MAIDAPVDEWTASEDTDRVIEMMLHSAGATTNKDGSVRPRRRYSRYAPDAFVALEYFLCMNDVEEVTLRMEPTPECRIEGDDWEAEGSAESIALAICRALLHHQGYETPSEGRAYWEAERQRNLTWRERE